MSRNGSGVYTAPATDFPAVASTLIESTKFNNVVNDIATALTNSLAANGETTVTANIPMNSKKLTGLAVATTSGDALSYGQAATVTTLSASSTITSTLATGAVLTNSAASTSQKWMYLANTGGNIQVGVESSAGGALITGSSAYDSAILTASGTGLAFSCTGGAAMHMRLSATGLAVTGTLSATGITTITGNNDITSIGGLAHFIVKAGDTNNDYAMQSFQTSAGGSIAVFGAKATTTGAAGVSVGQLEIAVQNAGSTTVVATLTAGATALTGTLSATSTITARPSTSTHGYAVLGPGDSSSSGYVAFYSYTGGTRQGYIGSSATDSALDAGTVKYIAGTHAFTGAITGTTSITGSTLVSTVATGTAPLTVSSTTEVANLKAATATLATTATTANQLDSGKVTIASHATTADIFAAAGNTIDWTGTATTTAFPNAAKAGMTRTLICADACAFTAGANLLIEGVPSGTTVTMAANAIVKVLAITTSQFKITYSASGTFTITGTGFTVNPTATAKYKVENGFVNLHIPQSQLTGTSNTTSFAITGCPACITPANYHAIPLAAKDNSVNVHGTMYAGTSSWNLYNGVGVTGGNTWTSSGTKELITSEFSYHLAAT